MNNDLEANKNNDALRKDDALLFLYRNNLTSGTFWEHIRATEKGKRLLDYLGLTYDYESYTRYMEVYRSIPKEHKDSIKLITKKEIIGRKTMHFQWIHSIIIPKYYNDSSPVPSKLFNQLKEEFITHFGGATCFNAGGYYISPYGLQEDKCEIWEGFGSEASQLTNNKFLEIFAIKAGGSQYCNQDAITISERPGNIKIVETLDMQHEISLLQKNRLFSLRSMVLLAGVASTDFSEQNLFSVIGLANVLGFV